MCCCADGNATISISTGGQTKAGALQVCGAATIWSPDTTAAPWEPGCASLMHLGYESFGVGLRELSQLTAGTHTLEFGSSPGAGGAVDYLTVDLEPHVDPIVFSSGGYVTAAQGYAWPRGRAALVS